jgi:hypothetical protein
MSSKIAYEAIKQSTDFLIVTPFFLRCLYKLIAFVYKKTTPTLNYSHDLTGLDKPIAFC